MKVGFIGLGKMGTAMVGRLLKSGHDVAVYNRTASKAIALVEVGATAVSTVAEAASYGSAVITMLENDDALKGICTSETGLISSLPNGTVHIAMGTHSIALIKDMTRIHGEAGKRFVCTPVLGRPPVAEAGQLGIIVGGEPDALTACQALFEAMGRRTYDCGPDPVSAAAAKIVNNFILACSIEALGEGFALGRKCGLPALSLYDILTDNLFSGPAHKVYGKIIADQDYFEQPGFSAMTGLKDILLALSAGQSTNVPLPCANVCRDRLLSAIANGNAEADWAVMAHEQARASGLD